MKRIFALLLCLALTLTALVTPALAENKFHFDSDDNALFEGETLALVLVREGDCADEGVLTFTSSNTRVATVDEDGNVSGLTKGTTTITAKLQGDKRTWTTKLEVKVKRAVTSMQVKEDLLALYDPWDPAVAEALNPNSEYADLPVMVLRAGKTQKISANLQPSDASDRSWRLLSSDERIVKPSGFNFVAKSGGECVVTVQSKQNPEVFTSYRALVVESVTRVRVSGEEKTLYVGDQLLLEAEVSPATATIRSVIWSSDNQSNASVDEYGMVTGVSKGNAKITAKAADGSGQYGTFTVTVRQQPEEITLNNTDVSLKSGNYITLKPTVLPSITNDKTVTWETSDATVAKVNSSGRVTGVNAGGAVITCRSKTHPDIYAEAYVNVYQPVTKIAFVSDNAYVGVGESISLDWTVTPSTATDTSVTLSTNKENVLEVSQDGTVYGLKRGEAYVYAKANDGSGKQGRIKVTVTQPVQGVKMKYDEVAVGVGQQVTNTANLQPTDATITAMTWTVEDARIATVKGSKNKPTVTGRSWGATKVIGVTEDGKYVATFTVRVGDENEALKIVNLYAEDDYVRIQVQNQSDLTITRFYYEIELYDAWGNPLDCNAYNWSNRFEGSYNYTLGPGDATRHGRFSFGSEFSRPQGIGRVVMTITGYETEDGSHFIRESKREPVEWKATVIDWNNY